MKLKHLIWIIPLSGILGAILIGSFAEEIVYGIIRSNSDCYDISLMDGPETINQTTICTYKNGLMYTPKKLKEAIENYFE